MKNERLTKLYMDWQMASNRVTMAQQTLTGAQQDALLRKGRLEGAVELLGGDNATWKYDPEQGVVVTSPDGASFPPLPMAQVPTPPMMQVPNGELKVVGPPRAVRRQIARDLKKEQPPAQ